MITNLLNIKHFVLLVLLVTPVVQAQKGELISKKTAVITLDALKEGDTIFKQSEDPRAFMYVTKSSKIKGIKHLDRKTKNSCINCPKEKETKAAHAPKPEPKAFMHVAQGSKLSGIKRLDSLSQNTCKHCISKPSEVEVVGVKKNHQSKAKKPKAEMKNKLKTLFSRLPVGMDFMGGFSKRNLAILNLRNFEIKQKAPLQVIDFSTFLSISVNKYTSKLLSVSVKPKLGRLTTKNSIQANSPPSVAVI